MSIMNTRTISCPKCGKRFDVKVWQSVNTETVKPSSVISGELFTASCPKCGVKFPMHYDTMYHDMNRHFMIAVAYKETGEYYKKSLRELRSIINGKHGAFKGYTWRIVNSIGQLIQTVSAIEADRDDRLVELCIACLEDTFSKEDTVLDFEQSQYCFVDGKEQLYVPTSDAETAVLELSDEYFEKVKKLFPGFPESLPEEDPPIYDLSWARKTYKDAVEQYKKEHRI